ncbi:MAG: RT0821/Lpp0805 family surface protein [Gammaproteobacteria bacterium]
MSSFKQKARILTNGLVASCLFGATMVTGDMGFQEVYAAPPPWAPAHGYRHKHGAGHHYVAHPQPVYHHADVGIPYGTCHRHAVGAILGGVVGGVAGAQVGRGDGKTAATIAGTLLGVLIGSHVGRTMDQADRYCTAQVLEQAADRQSIVWHNPEAQAEYRVTPVTSYTQQGQYCREYLTEAEVGGVPQQVYGTACRSPDGAWQIVN